jgi:pimeloyl-ACP methyl ester carboxylesterase
VHQCHVRSWGSGPPVVLIHGVAGSGLIWSPVADRLAASHQVIAVDLLGYGHSPKPRVRYTPAVHVDAIRRAVAPVLAGRRATVAGLSMGGLLALEYAARYPGDVERLVHVGMPYYRDRDEARRGLRANVWTALTLEASPLARVAIGTLWGVGRHSRMLSRALAPKLYAGEVARESMMAQYHSFSSTLRECLLENRVEPLLAATEHVPSTFVHGDSDRWCPAERIEALVAPQPNWRLDVVAGVGHNVTVLDSDAVARVLLEPRRTTVPAVS